MKANSFKRRPPGLSGSAWRKIYEITTASGKYSPKQIAKRQARAMRQEGEYAL